MNMNMTAQTTLAELRGGGGPQLACCDLRAHRHTRRDYQDVGHARRRGVQHTCAPTDTRVVL
jgi:hypothetical protein